MINIYQSNIEERDSENENENENQNLIQTISNNNDIDSNNNNNIDNTINTNNNNITKPINSFFSGSENYMIVSRVLSNNDLFTQEKRLNSSSGSIGNKEDETTTTNKSLPSLIISVPSVSTIYKGYNNLTPYNSDSSSDDDDDDDDDDNSYNNSYNNNNSNSINGNNSNNSFLSTTTTKTKPINIKNSNDDFENIEIQKEYNNREYNEQVIASSSLSPPQVSPFKQLLTNKLRSIKDKIDSPSHYEKYNTFPMDRYNNIPSSDISLLLTPSNPASISSLTLQYINNNNNNNNSNNTTNTNCSSSNSSSNNSSSNIGIINTTTTSTTLNNNNNNNNNNNISITSPIYHSNIDNNITTNEQQQYEMDTFETDSQYSNKTMDESIIEFKNNSNSNGNNLIRCYSNSSITRPVLTYEKTKLNYKILTLLSLSVFFSVSNLYYAQPLLNEFVKEFQISNGVASLITASVQLGYALGLTLISILGDSMSKKKLTLILSMITCAALVGIGLSPHIIPVIIFHFIVGVSTIIPYIAIPLALDMTNPIDRSGIVGILLSSIFVGLLGARVLSGVIGHLFGWRVVFYFASITMFIISILLFYFLPYTPRNQNIIPYNKLLLSVVEFLKKEKELRQTCFIGSMVFATFGILWTTLSFKLDKDYGYNSGFIGLFGLVGMAGAISSPLSGRLANKFGINRLMVCYLLICASGYVMLMFLDNHIIGLIAGIFILDLGVQSAHIGNQSRNNQLSSSQLDESSKYNINTLYMASYFIGGSLGSGLAGAIYTHWDWSGSCIVALLFLALAMTCHLITYESQSSSPPLFIPIVENNNNVDSNNNPTTTTAPHN